MTRNASARLAKLQKEDDEMEHWRPRWKDGRKFDEALGKFFEPISPETWAPT